MKKLLVLMYFTLVGCQNTPISTIPVAPVNHAALAVSSQEKETLSYSNWKQLGDLVNKNFVSEMIKKGAAVVQESHDSPIGGTLTKGDYQVAFWFKDGFTYEFMTDPGLPNSDESKKVFETAFEESVKELHFSSTPLQKDYFPPSKEAGAPPFSVSSYTVVNTDPFTFHISAH